jgi:hypothetical protein
MKLEKLVHVNDDVTAALLKKWHCVTAGFFGISKDHTAFEALQNTHTATHSHTPENLGIPQSINVLNLDISCLQLLLTQKQVFQYHYIRILSGENHSGHDVTQEGTVHVRSPILLSASLLTQLTLLLSGITYQIITHIVMLTSLE